MEEKFVRLKVMEAVQDDVNKGIVKIDSSFMRQLGVNIGDVVEVKGERVTAAIVDRAYPGDIGLNIIRMDGNTRKNARTSIGELVEIKKAEIKAAKKIIIAPANKGLMIKAHPQFFKQGLMGKVLVKGDIVSLGRGGPQRRVNLQTGRIEDVFSQLENPFVGFGFGDIKFLIVDTLPKKEISIVTQETEVEFNPQAVEIKEEEQLGLGINYEDIGGLGDEIKKVREMIELPLKHPEIFEKLGIEAPKGVLLHGPPGTGKTLLAKAVASETNSHFILINGPEVISKFYGESEKNLRDKFEDAEKNAPSIIFFDEIDAIATKREETKGDVEKRVVAQLLGLMDGLKNRGKVIVIAATNIPNLLDPALRRPGRFDREIEIGVPDKEGRLDILKIHTRNMPLKGNPDVSLIAKHYSKECKNKLQELEISLKEKEEKLKLLEERKKKADESTLIKIIESIRGLNKELELTNQDLIFFKKIIEDKKSERKIAEEIKKWNEAKVKYSITDPRFQLILNKMDEDFATLQKLQIPELVMQKAEVESIPKELEDIARITHGFVGADLNALAKEAAMIVLRRILPDLNLDKNVEEEKPIPQEVLEKLMVTQKDFLDALKVVRPSAMREVLVETPDVSWEDVGGMETVKENLKEAVEWPLKNPEIFKRMGIRPPKGILLYGPPGTGKTMLAKAVAKESESNFILVTGAELLSKWVNETPQQIKKIFTKARQVSPSIIFIDEIENIAPKRNEHTLEGMGAVNQMLSEMDGLETLNDVLVLGATNRPDMVDPALLRPGRFDRVIFTPIPDVDSRKKIFEVHTKKMPLTKDVNIHSLAERTQGYVGADIEGVCREAAMFALREDMKSKQVAMKHFEKALDVIRPSVSDDIEETYKQFAEYFSSARAKQIKQERASYVG